MIDHDNKDAPAIGHELATEILDALEIKAEYITSMSLHCEAGKLAWIEIRKEVPIREAEKIGEILKNYKLVRKEDA